MNTQTDGTVAERHRAKKLFLVSVPIFDWADEYLSIWQFTAQADEAKSLIDRLSHLLYLDQRWLILKHFWPDSMSDCTTLADAGYLIGDFTVVKLEADLIPCSQHFGSPEEIDLSALPCSVATVDKEDELAGGPPRRGKNADAVR